MLAALREQALREEWAGQGMFAKLKDLPDRGARNRVECLIIAAERDTIAGDLCGIVRFREKSQRGHAAV